MNERGSLSEGGSQEEKHRESPETTEISGNVKLNAQGTRCSALNSVNFIRNGGVDHP